MNFSNKNLLFFFPESPFSKRAGNVLRTYTNLKQLKSVGLSIDLVGVEDYYKSFGDTVESIDFAIINDVFVLKTKPPKKKLTFEYWKYKIQKKFNKQHSNQYLTQYLKDNFTAILDKKKYDYIFINYEFWTDLIRDQDLKGAKTIVDTHDWITLNEFYNNKNLDLGTRFGEEIKNLSFYDKVVTISQDEYFIFKSFLGDKVINIPPSFPENFEDTNTEKKYDLIFVGSDNPFNVLSINWFVERVLPLLSKEIKICIIGRICKHVPDHESIEKVFFTDNLETYYQASKIAICPMLKGTGIKIKVVEAMSYGLPIVGTEKAVDGFSDKKNNGCRVSDNEIIFADIIKNLLNNPSDYERQKQEAIHFFKNNFSEKKSVELWEKTLIF
ncbi:glycosyltransferase [Chryseobacterium camelliae]|uniref:Glycosyltransferase n=1 Tax=Chryseobacterium camelliae TaxID=1265445 RepID=A0ABY7QQR1_9FLAO|nr:glycosyltransferase [Chryseobacterium camelliae]WBV61972.1 glycosyltransferase [Chryseobacterium camelliae]